jgi:hypothetical protein
MILRRLYLPIPELFARIWIAIPLKLAATLIMFTSFACSPEKLLGWLFQRKLKPTLPSG